MTSNRQTDVIVIGAGFSGLAAATNLARQGRSVVVLERHSQPGGRARTFEESGFVFDMGPSWYWMPDVFEQFFADAGSRVEDLLELVRLDPSYRVFFDTGPLDVPAGRAAVRKLFERLEPGSGPSFDAFMSEAERKYRVGMRHFVDRPAHSALEFVEPGLATEIAGLSMFSSLSRQVRRHFRDPRLRQLLEFPVLFLGARPEKTPALYSLMNYADTVLGTWYPMGGMHQVVRAMVSVAEAHGVEFRFGTDVESIIEQNGMVASVRAGGRLLKSRAVVATADYHHVEQNLLPEQWRRYSPRYWSTRRMSPGALLFYLGLDRRVDGLLHHNLFFDRPFAPHARAIYDTPAWPTEPLFYVCAPSRTDPSVAPPGHENLFVLIPLAAGLRDEQNTRQKMFDHVMDRLAEHLAVDLRSSIVFRRDYAHAEFEADYSAYRGNAYGLANTLRQTAFLKPKMRSRLGGLFFAGQLTTPGPGVPPSLISGRIAAREAIAWLAARSSSGLEVAQC